MVAHWGWRAMFFVPPAITFVILILMWLNVKNHPEETGYTIPHDDDEKPPRVEVSPRDALHVGLRDLLHLLHVRAVEVERQTVDDEWDELFRVNLGHVFTCTRAVLPLMIEQADGGSIVNVSTIEAFRAIPTRRPSACRSGRSASARLPSNSPATSPPAAAFGRLAAACPEDPRSSARKR